ncbi:MAG: putative maltokinase [Isosphaeraceae bacterium]
MLPVINLSGGWNSLLIDEARATLERDVLPVFLLRQRWFAGKARDLDAVRVIDATVPGSFPGDSALVLIEAAFRDGGTDTYLVPLSLSSGVETETGQALARIEGPEGPSVLRDGLTDDALCAALLYAIESGREITTGLGRIRATSTSAYTEARGPGTVTDHIKRGSAEQSNTNILFADRLILKVFRRLEPGLNPDLEIGRFLTRGGRFDRVPKTAGSIEYDRPGAEPITLAMLQRLVPNQGTGWEHALEGLRDYLGQAVGPLDMPGLGETDGRPLSALALTDPPSVVAQAIGDSLREAALLGRRTAELHRALASDPDDPKFAPEPLTKADLATLASDVRAQVEAALNALRSNLDRLDDANARQGRQVLDQAPGLLALLDRLPDLDQAGVKVRCHGDYHLGQVLWTGDDYVILDFEGEPARPLAKRTEKQSPIKDVVGMIRSFDYAAFAALFDATKGLPDELERLTPRTRAWRTWTSAAFLREYLNTIADASLLPTDPAALTPLLHAFTLDKALYELLYELNNRPSWVRIPLQGIAALIEPMNPGPKGQERGQTL